MPPDCYRVEVLYLLNPHLIWVEVQDESSQNGFNFQQIGLYGVLPLDTTIDLEAGELTTQECEDWLPGAAAIIRQLLDGGGEVWFTATFIDRRSSIFDDNIHKFGDLLIKKTPGKSKSISNMLKTSGFATFDECRFHLNLREGKIKTKLSSSATQEVIKEIEKYFLRKNVAGKAWEKPIRSQTSVFRAMHEIESSLTTTNLDKHNQSMKKLIEGKKKDLELCKGVDERSVGRGMTRKQQDSKLLSPVERKIQLLNAKKNKFTPKIEGSHSSEHVETLEDTKMFLEANSTPHAKKLSTDKAHLLKKVMSKSDKKLAKHEQLSAKTQDQSGSVSNTSGKSTLQEPPDLIKVPNKDNEKESVPPIQEEIGTCSTIKPASSELEEGPKFIRIRPKRRHSKKEHKTETHLQENLEKQPDHKVTEDLHQSINEETKLICVCPVSSQRKDQAVQCDVAANDIQSSTDLIETQSHDSSILQQDIVQHSQVLDKTNNEIVSEILHKLQLAPSVDFEVLKKSIHDYNTKKRDFALVFIDEQQFEEGPSTSKKSLQFKESLDSYPESDVLILENGMFVVYCPVHDTVLILDKSKETNKTYQKDMDMRVKTVDATTQSEPIACGKPEMKASKEKLVTKKLKIAGQGVSVQRQQKEKKADRRCAASDLEMKNIIVDLEDNCDKMLNTAKSCLVEDFKVQDTKEPDHQAVDSMELVSPSTLRKRTKAEVRRMLSKPAYGPPGIDLRKLTCRVPPLHLAISSGKGKRKEKLVFPKSSEVGEPSNDKSKRRQDSGSSSSTLWERKVKQHKGAKNRRQKCASNTSDTTSKDTENSPDSGEENAAAALNVSNVAVGNNSVRALDKIPPQYYTYQAYKDLRANPYLNYGRNRSVFVDTLVSPIMMVHSKMDKRIVPVSYFREVNFGDHIRMVLNNLRIHSPMMLQSITWNCILAGHSVFVIGAANSGKTMGYLPALCRLVADSQDTGSDCDSVGPISVIVCATSQSVSDVERVAKLFLGRTDKVVSSYFGHDEMAITTSLLNGCEILISTPPSFVRLLKATDFGVDLRRLSTLVLDDCERLSDVYGNELKYIFNRVNEMSKTRVNKELKVQYIVAARIWCDFMEPLAKRAPDSVVCIGSFQECVLYARANMTVSYVDNKTKLKCLFDFLKNVVPTKRTVIVCDSDDEVKLVHDALKMVNYHVFPTDSKMTVEDLYNLSIQWREYNAPLISPILICRDCNLYHMNIVNANYLVQYSLPSLYSTFCRRFATLNESYASIFKTPDQNQDVKILILLEKNNVENFPKIINFVRRCSNNVPEYIDGICETILAQKDARKAENFAPLCSTLLKLGDCPDLYNCQYRHNFHKVYDKPKAWVPTSGVIKFNVLNVVAATHYTARLIANLDIGSYIKYPAAYGAVSMKMGVYYSNEKNRVLLGIPKVGDICAVSSGNNKFARCQVIKIIDKYERGNPKNVLVNLLDEEIIETARDIDLYHLPDDVKDTDTYVVHVRMANIRPRDKDIVFSKLAQDHIRSVLAQDQSLYIKGQVVFAISNCVFVDTLEVCKDLRSVNETVVITNMTEDILNNHGEVNKNHITKLVELCRHVELDVTKEKTDQKTSNSVKAKPEERWSYLDRDMATVYFGSAEDPDTLFVRLTKFEDCLKNLIQDIQTFVTTNNSIIENLQKDDIVLAEYPDDSKYERARIDQVDELKVKCFFVDQGEWRHLTKDKFKPITDKLITQMPFQAIECRLVGVKPPSNQWSDYATSWLYDKCFESRHGGLKQLYVKYFTKEPAQFTGGHKYGIVVIDTYDEQDLNINKKMIELNLAAALNDESKYLDFIQYNNNIEERSYEECTDSDDTISKQSENVNMGERNLVVSQTLPSQPIRSVPLVGSEEESDDFEWNMNIGDEFEKILRPVIGELTQNSNNTLLAIENSKSDQSLESNLNNPSEVIEEIPLQNLKVFENSELSLLENANCATNESSESYVGENTEKTSSISDVKSTEDDDKFAIENKANESQQIDENFENENVKESPSHQSITLNIDVTKKQLDSEDLFPEHSTSIVEPVDDLTERIDTEDLSLKLSSFVVEPAIDMTKSLDSEDLSPKVSSLIIEQAKGLTKSLDSEDVSSKDSDTLTKPAIDQPKSSDSEDISQINFSAITEPAHCETNPKTQDNNLYPKTTEKCQLRKPKLNWLQTKATVTIKIQLIGVENYNLEIKDRALKFDAVANETNYGFELDLYGVIDSKKASHSNKGQYILVKLEKILKRNWLTLSNDSRLRKWISYDLDSIDPSSEEEEVEMESLVKIVKDMQNDSNTDSDEDFVDDAKFEYKARE